MSQGSAPTVPFRGIVIGAVRRRQGIGEFVARGFAAAGTEVCAVVGSSERTATQAARNLSQRYGIQARSYHELSAALESEKPDFVAICSPYEVHLQHLSEVAAAGCHCLCEKPLWWHSGKDPRHQTAELVDAFSQNGKHLGLLTQWPATLVGYDRLHPQVRSQPIESFAMLMSPISSGTEMVLDSAPHFISMAQHLMGRGTVTAVRAEYGKEVRSLALGFTYLHSSGSAAMELRLTTKELPPRPAGYAINGCWVQRQVRLPEYDLYFESEGQTIRIEDPLDLWIQEFFQKIAANAPPQRQELIDSMGILETLVEVTRDAVPGQPAQRDFS